MHLDSACYTGIAARILQSASAASGGTSASSLLYVALLSMLSTLIYLVIGALLVGAIALYLFWALFGLPSRVYGIVARSGAYPQLAAALGEVAGRVGVKAPQWVIIFPGAGFTLPAGCSGAAPRCRSGLWG
ncbi:MAG TPA: hypothetical protein VF739_16205 [Ktedonobacterales bacterium]